MILYHGTTNDKCKSIYRDGKLDVTTELNTHYPKEGHFKTTYGYAYFTDNPLAALEFACRCWTNIFGEGYRLLSVLEVDIPEELIEIDYEEIELQSLTIKDAKCYRISKPLETNHILRSAYFSFLSSDTCYKYIDTRKCNDIIWSSYNDIEWNDEAGIMAKRF